MSYNPGRIASGVLLLWLGLTSNAEPPEPKPGEIERLIKQLGSERFAQRDEAFQRLETIGLPAVPALGEPLKKAALQAEVGFRMEIVGNMERRGRKYPQRNVAFLASFLNDDTVRDIEADPKKFEPYYSGRDFPRLAVRDLAAMGLAQLLEIPVDPQPDWKPEQWADLRQKVKAALESQ